MKLLTLTCAIFLLALSLRASPPPEYWEQRNWTGSNGAVFLGQFVRMMEEGKKVEFLTSSGKVVRTDFDNLSEKDQEVVLVLAGKAPANPKTDPKLLEDALKKLPVGNRSLIPQLKAHDYGARNDESIVDAIWVSVLWWDVSEVVSVPKSGDFKRKAEWLHQELSRYIAKGGRRAASLEDAKEGLGEYFERRLEDTAACKVTISSSQEPADLSKLVTGNDIVILKMSMTYSNDKSYVACGSLESIDENGNFTMNLFGVRMQGKMTLVPDQPKGTKMYEAILSDRKNLPEHYLNNEARFFIGKNRWEGTFVMSPYVYKTPGKKFPIPE